MGGGDLNLKKSWHPQTLRNVEKVWKAEQKAAAEAKKIEELRKELENERVREEMQQYAIDQGIVRKKDERLDWMYSTPGEINREEYLLGKLIDKKVDPLAQNEGQDDLIPGSSFASSSLPSSTNDLAAKVREDPLFMIKRKEDEKKKELLNNPVRMKQLQLMLRASMQEKETGKKEKKKKKKKDKKERRKEKELRSNSSSESEEEKFSGRKKYKESSRSPSPVKHHRHQDKNMDRRHHHHKSQSHRNSNHQIKDHYHDQTSHSKLQQKGYDDNRHFSKRTDDHGQKRSYNTSNHHAYKDNRSPSLSPVRHKKSPLHKHRSPSPSYRHEKKKSYKMDRHRSDGRDKSPDEIRWKRDSFQRKTRSSSPSPKKRRDNSPPQPRQRGSNITRKLDPEELERRRAEMMGNAQWRDEHRKQNVNKYREEEAREEQEHEKNKKRAAEFLQPMKLQSFSSNATSSVEDRIKRNINSVQRTPAALENFLQK